MRRAIAPLLLLGLGFAYVVHPLAHGLEQNPDICCVAQMSSESPALTPTPHLPSAPPTHKSSVAVTEAPELTSGSLASQSSRGPPQA